MISEPGMSSFTLPVPTASGSRSSLQACLSPTGPPSDNVTLGPSSECVIAPPTDRLDGQGDDANRPGRKLQRTLKRPRRFESPVGRVTGDKGKKKKGNVIDTRNYQDDSYATRFCKQKSIDSSSILQSLRSVDCNLSEYAMFSNMGHVPIESDVMALHPVLPEAKNASIPAAIHASGESKMYLN